MKYFRLTLYGILLAGLQVFCSGPEEDLPAGGEDWSFIVMGDVRQGFGIYNKLALHIGELEPAPSMTFNVGDFLLTPGNQAEWTNFWRYSEPITEKMPIYLLRGNHEGNDPGSEEVFFDNMPYFGDRFYGAIGKQKVEFILLDTEIREQEGGISGNQLEWLRQALDSASADPAIEQVFILLHRPLYPQGKHQGEDLYNAAELHELFLSHEKIRAVFAGHDHLFNLFILDDLPYITTGGGGGPLYHGYGGDYYHFTKVSIYEDIQRINIKTIGLFGEVVEDFDL